MAHAILSVRVDAGTKEAFSELCDQLGMTASSAVNMFVSQMLRERRLPFVPALDAAPGGAVLGVGRIREAVARAAKQFPGISGVTLFGSYARGEAGPESDIDLRVAYDPATMGLIDISLFASEVERDTGKRIDVVSRHDLGSDAFAERVREEGVVLYERSTN